jgi:hypothetical protein
MEVVKKGIPTVLFGVSKFVTSHFIKWRTIHANPINALCRTNQQGAEYKIWTFPAILRQFESFSNGLLLHASPPDDNDVHDNLGSSSCVLLLSNIMHCVFDRCVWIIVPFIRAQTYFYAFWRQVSYIYIYIRVYGLVLASQKHTKNIFAFHIHSFHKTMYEDEELW